MRDMTISELRKELGLTLAEFAPMIGLTSLGYACEITRGEKPPSIRVAIKLEQLSGGRIKAADLNEDVALVLAHMRNANP